MEKKIGEVDHFFNHISVAAIVLTGSLSVGETIHIIGATTDFIQPINSMEIDRQKIDKVTAGQSVGIRTVKRVRKGDTVYKIIL